MNANLLLAGLLAGMAGNVPVSTPEAGCQLLAPQVEVSPGQEVRVPISLKAAPGLAAMELDIA